MPEISWSELVTLMVHGPDLPTRGRLRHSDGVRKASRAWIRSSGTPLPPPFATGVEVSMWGRRLRLADAEGRLTMITDGTTAWTFDPEAPDAPPHESPLDHVEFGLAGSDVLVRTTARTWLDYDGRDAPAPTPTTYAGRAAWAVQLTPLYRTDAVVQAVVDAETGMLLQQRDDEQARITEWSEIAVGADLDPAAFTWDGPVVTWTQQQELTQRDNEHQQAAWEEKHARWTREQLGLDRLTVTVTADLLVRSLEDDGTLHASLGDLGALDRRPRSEDPWPEVEFDDDAGADVHHDGRLVHRWSNDRWDWAVRTWGDARLADGAIDVLREQLERGRTSG